MSVFYLRVGNLSLPHILTFSQNQIHSISFTLILAPTPPHLLVFFPSAISKLLIYLHPPLHLIHPLLPSFLLSLFLSTLHSTPLFFSSLLLISSLNSSLLSPLLSFTNTMLNHSYFLGTLTFKSLFLMNPQVSAVDAEFKGTHDDLPYYSRISLGTFNIPVVNSID